MTQTRSKRLAWVGATTLASVILVLAAIHWLWLLPPPRVTGSTQITHDGTNKNQMATDGSRIYLGAQVGGHYVLEQVSSAGGETSEIPTPFQNIVVADIAHDHSQLLIGSFQGTAQEARLWALPLPSGSPRSLGSMMKAGTGTLSPDGRQLLYGEGSSLYLANSDGSNPRILTTLSGLPRSARFSPDGRRIRFTVNEAGLFASSIWEMRSDGSNLHRVLPKWRTPPAECCGEWTPDGRYYVFVGATTNAALNLFALADDISGLRRAPSAPVQLTTGPLIYYSVLPSLDGKRLFTAAMQPRSQIVRYDSTVHQFVPYLAISATDLAFSPDGKWVAYVSVPDGTLWRSRADGTDRLQLTYPPPFAALPSWSPDGTRIAYTASAIGQPTKALVISAQGGTPEELLPGTFGVDFNWSNDGKQIIFGESPGSPKSSIRTLDLQTHETTVIPGSEGLFSPRRSPDGRYLAALSQDSSTLMLYDFRAQVWSKWLTEPGNIAYPTWSRDGTYIYFDNFLTDQPAAHRVKLGSTTSEELYSLSGLRQFQGVSSGVWSGLAPDGSRLYTQDLSVQEIYALDVEFP